jgi:hypothetical protein
LLSFPLPLIIVRLAIVQTGCPSSSESGGEPGAARSPVRNSEPPSGAAQLFSERRPLLHEALNFPHNLESSSENSFSLQRTRKAKNQ